MRGRRPPVTSSCSRPPASSPTSAGDAPDSTGSTGGGSGSPATGWPGSTATRARQRRKRMIAATTDGTPRLFRINIEVGDIERAAAFYAELLEIESRPQPGSRCYFRAGPVTLQVVEVADD